MKPIVVRFCHQTSVPIYETFQTELFINPWYFFPGFQWLQVKRIRSWKRKCTVATRRGSKVKKQQQWNGVCQCHETTHETKEQYSKWFGKQKLKKQVKQGLCVSFKPSSLKDVKNARWNQGKQKITHYCHALKVATVLNFLRLCSEKVYRFGNKSWDHDWAKVINSDLKKTSEDCV